MNNPVSKKPDNTGFFNNSFKQMTNNQNVSSSSKSTPFSNIPNDFRKSTNSTSNSDFNSIFESIKNSTLNNSNFNIQNEEHNSEYNNPFSNLDIGTILKIKSIMDKMNNSTNDPRSNLLLSLKPYLKESRKEKVDQYIKIFSMTQIFQNLNNGGEK